jgi:hypothetical protein
MRPAGSLAQRQRAIGLDRLHGLLFHDNEIARRSAVLDPIDQNRQHVHIRRPAAADMIDAGRGIKPHEVGDVAFVQTLLNLPKVADAGVRLCA